MPQSLNTLRQTAAKLLNYAMVDLFPTAKLAGSSISQVGFTCDFYIEHPIDQQLTTTIEERMRFLIKKGLTIDKLDMMRENAVELFFHHQQPFLAAIISENENNICPILKINRLYDICDSHELANLEDLKAIKIFTISAESIDLPDHNNLPIIRITGTVFSDNYALKKFIKLSDKAKKLNHESVGQEMHLFSLQENNLTWLPNGASLVSILKNNLQKNLESQGFQPLISQKPHKLNHAQAFNLLQPYPNKFYEFIQKNNLGESNGLLLSPSYTADLQTTFCAPKEVTDELISSLQFISQNIMMFGFKYQWYLIPNGDHNISTKNWSPGLNWINKALKICEIDYILDNEEKARYGPRIEMRLKDALEQEWRGPYLEIDFQTPKQANLKAQAEIMINRSVFGSLERFIAILIENCGGVLPLWLTPEQVRVLPLSEKNLAYAKEIQAELKQKSIRTHIDCSNDKLGTKIHRSEIERIPYMVIVGENEEKTKTITVRSSQKSAMINKGSLEAFSEQLRQEENSKSIRTLGDRKSFESQ